MFLEYYGLREQPFGVTPDPRFFYPSAVHREALASLVYSVESGVGFTALLAEPGMGKTTLLYDLLQRFQSSASTAFIFETQCNSRELLRSLLLEFNELQGHESSDDDVVALMSGLKQFLVHEARAGRRVLLLIDEAQNLEDSVLETVRLLSNFETSRAKLLHIVLSGQPQLAMRLARPELAQIRQRLTMVNRLVRFGAGDVVRYIAHRLRRAGYEGPPLFTAEALSLVAIESRGIPREINRLCFNALSMGCALERKTIGEDIIREVSSDLDFEKLLDDAGLVSRPSDVSASEFAAEFTKAFGAEANTAAEPQHRTPANTDMFAIPPGVEQQFHAAPASRSVHEQVHAGTVAKHLAVANNAPKSCGAAALEFAGTEPRSSTRGYSLFTYSLAAVVAVVLIAFGGWTARKSNKADSSHATAQPTVTRPPLQGLQQPATAPGNELTPVQLPVTVSTATPHQHSRAIVIPKPRAARSARNLGIGRAQERFAQPAPPSTGDSARATPTALVLHSPPPAAARTDAGAPLPSDSMAPPRPTISEVSKLLSARPDSTVPLSIITTRSDQPVSTFTPASSSGPADPAPSSESSANADPRTDNPRTVADVPSSGSEPPVSTGAVPARLVKRVLPIYPQVALAQGLQGEVVLDALIDKSGHISSVHVVNGPLMLRQAALDAVRQWSFEPALVNGRPQEARTTITLNFRR